MTVSLQAKKSISQVLFPNDIEDGFNIASSLKDNVTRLCVSRD